jgi:activator of HSP90 ATPase
MVESFKISEIIKTEPEELYLAWLNSKKHAAFTGASAKISPKVGGSFSAWDGYIFGKNLKLEPPKKIVQAWRTTEFDKSDPDSKLEITFTKARGGTKITFTHSNIPDGQSDEYKQGWKDYYFTPMKKFFK